MYCFDEVIHVLIVKEEDWKNIGKRFYGANKNIWEFKCPIATAFPLVHHYRAVLSW